MIATPPIVSQPSGKFVTSDGAEIWYRSEGDGAPLVMVHGWSQSSAMFQHQIGGLSDRYRVIAADVRGHGESPAPKGGLRIARLALDLAELAEHLEIGSFNLLGWSMGVSVCWAYVDMFGTDRINKFVFVDQPSMLTLMGDMSETEAMDAGTLFSMQDVNELYVALRGETGEEKRAEFVQSMVTASISEELLKWIIAENAKTPLGVAARLLLSHATNDWRDVLERIDKPTLVLAGLVSHVSPRSQHYVASCIEGAQLYEFSAEEGGAHFPFLEAPGRFNTVVGEFLDQLR